MESKLVGYTAGVYDLFHRGHLNLLRAARARCDYLVVGVNSDEACFSYKKKYPVFSLGDRIEIVRAIRYVDEVVVVEDTDKRRAYDRVQFDRIFVGDDHMGEPKWLELEAFLSARSSCVVYLPHTEGISSTSLVALIQRSQTSGKPPDIRGGMA